MPTRIGANVGRPSVFTPADRILLDGLLTERALLEKQLADIPRKLKALSNKAIAEKFEVSRSTINGYAIQFELRTIDASTRHK